MDREKELSKSWLFLNNRAYVFLFLLVRFINVGQVANYVSNGSFEQKYDCSFPYYLCKVKYWLAIDSATSFSGAHLSVCNGYVPYQGNTEFQYPRTGNSFILSGFFCDPSVCPNPNRGYLKNRLKTTLQSGKIYCVKFYVNIANTSPYGMDGFGAYFGNNQIDTITKCTIPLTYINPQVQNPNGNIIMDTLGWTLVTGTFVASGNEKYMLIGNFKSDAATNCSTLNPAYLPQKWTDICIDDVSCIPIDLPAYAGPDMFIIPGNTVYIGRQQDVGIDEACTWYNMTNTTTPIAIAAGITVSPTITSTYIVKQDICGNIKWDTVVVYMSGVGLNELIAQRDNFILSPNPAQDILKIRYEIQTGKETKKIQVLNCIGDLIDEQDFHFTGGEAILDTKKLLPGVYFLRLLNSEEWSISKRFIISR